MEEWKRRLPRRWAVIKHLLSRLVTLGKQAWQRHYEARRLIEWNGKYIWRIEFGTEFIKCGGKIKG